jgi:hypothetical protein
MQFRTPIPIPKSDYPIDYLSKVVSLGSCFAENMAEQFHYFKFQNSCNPFGIIFNPVSLEKIIKRGVEKDCFTEKDIFFHNDLWHCYEVHSELSHPEKDLFLTQLNALVEAFYLQISEASHVIITYGTAWVYRHIESAKIVANCHKVPQKQFGKELLSVATIEKSIQNSMELIREINPDCKFIFTVSPVRHIKDGVVENQISKAHLISAIHSTHNSQLITYNYFPSYEIMMDELRDYRFYAEDMLHPSVVAVDYIWQRFKETAISETAFVIMEEVESIQKSLAHKPFNPNSESHLKFQSKLREKITKLESQYQFMKF